MQRVAFNRCFKIRLYGLFRQIRQDKKSCYKNVYFLPSNWAHFQVYFGNSQWPRVGFETKTEHGVALYRSFSRRFQKLLRNLHAERQAAINLSNSDCPNGLLSNGIMRTPQHPCVGLQIEIVPRIKTAQKIANLSLRAASKSMCIPRSYSQKAHIYCFQSALSNGILKINQLASVGSKLQMVYFK